MLSISINVIKVGIPKKTNFLYYDGCPLSNRLPASISNFKHYESFESEEHVHNLLITELFPPALLEKPSHLLINIC